MNRLEYLPGIGGKSIQLDGPKAFVGTADKLRSREWNYDLGYRDLLNANRPARIVDVTLWTDADTANALRQVADADVMAGTPGTFLAQDEWKQHGYILSAEPRAIHYGDLEIALKVALMDGAWWRMVEREFLPEETPVTQYTSATGESVIVSGATESPLHALTVYGKSVQDGTPSPGSPVAIQVVKPYVWNQLIQSMVSTTSDGITTSYDSTTGLFSIKNDNRTSNYGSGSTRGIACSNLVIGHKYYIGGDIVAGAGFIIDNVVNSLYQPGTVVTVSAGSTFKLRVTYQYDFAHVHPVGDVTSFYMFVCDLTLMFGAGLEPTAEQFESRFTESHYAYDAGSNVFGVDVDGVLTSIDLDGNVLAGLPDGTQDKLTIDSSGNASIKKNVGYIASYNGETVGDSYISSTGDLSTGAAVYYKLTSPTTISLSSITMPDVEDGSIVQVVGAITPTITAEWALDSDLYLDYPHNYPHDYSKIAAASSVESSVFIPSDVHLVIFGPATNPYILVGGNKYQVNVTVPSGGYVTIDGREKTIVLTLADGTGQNAFSYGVRGGGQGGGTYIFEPIPPGTQEVTYSGTFGFNLGWYEEEGEPPWKPY